jgi:hypothetical protein
MSNNTSSFKDERNTNIHEQIHKGKIHRVTKMSVLEQRFC